MIRPIPPSLIHSNIFVNLCRAEAAIVGIFGRQRGGESARPPEIFSFLALKRRNKGAGGGTRAHAPVGY